MTKSRELITRAKFNNGSTLIDWAVILLFLGISYVFYRHFDPTEMLTGDIHPWDSWSYQNLSNQLLANGLNNLSEYRPFSYRFVQPALVSLVRMLNGATYSEASHLVNIISTIFTTLFCFNFWRNLGLSRAYAYAGVVIITLSWMGPLRGSIYYPGGQYAFEILANCGAFWGLNKIYSAIKISDYYLPAVVIFIASLGRESIFYLVIICTLLLSFLRRRGQAYDVFSSWIVSTIPSLFGFLLARILVQGKGDYNILSTALSYGWFHLNVGEDLYVFFYSYGPLFLSFLICVSFSSSRADFARMINPANSICHRLIIYFCGVMAIFAFVGGTDSDRFLLWGLPFFYFLGLTSLRSLLTNITASRANIAVLTVFIIITSLWTRFYVPAIPHMLFTDKYNSQAGVKTNLNPSLYKGVPFIVPLREQLISVPPSEAYNSARIGDRDSLPQAFISKKLAKAYSSKSTDADEAKNSTSHYVSPYKYSYRSSVNNIPFPLGFPHNQNELLAIHPFHGSANLRALLLIQWIALYAFLVFSLYLRSFFCNNRETLLNRKNHFE